MEYEGAIYRPPSEAYSLLIQVSVGCSHNQCTFCSMYKDKQFKIKPIQQVIAEIENYQYKDQVEKVFLCDGDALVLPFEQLKTILQKIKENFKNVKRISSYATFQDIENKDIEQLKQLQDLGLDLLYLGAESGNDQILQNIKKGLTFKRMVEAGLKAKAAGFKLSIMLISGLGSTTLSQQHAIDSGKLISAINPEYCGLLTLMLQQGTPLYQDYLNGDFKVLDPRQTIIETKTLIENINATHCYFTSAHASNYFNLKGYLNQDKERLLAELDYYLNNQDSLRTKFRGL